VYSIGILCTVYRYSVSRPRSKFVFMMCIECFWEVPVPVLCSVLIVSASSETKTDWSLCSRVENCLVRLRLRVRFKLIKWWSTKHYKEPAPAKSCGFTGSGSATLFISNRYCIKPPDVFALQPVLKSRLVSVWLRPKNFGSGSSKKLPLLGFQHPLHPQVALPVRYLTKLHLEFCVKYSSLAIIHSILWSSHCKYSDCGEVDEG
jgi:hypothetical protein